MTLALYGKSGKRKAALIVSAFLALLVATIGGTVLQGNGLVAAATSSVAVNSASCSNSAETDDDVGGTGSRSCTTGATATQLNDTGTSSSNRVNLETDDSGSGTGDDDLSVVFDLAGLSGTVNSVTLKVWSSQSDDAGQLKAGSAPSGTNDDRYGQLALAAPQSYSNNDLKGDVQAALGSTLTVNLSMDCVPDSNDCGALVDKVELVVDVTAKGHIQIHKYIPKDNPSEGWKQEGASGAEDWRFDLSQGGSVVYNDLEDKLSGELVSGRYVASEDLSKITGWELVDIYVPGTNGNDQCEKDGPRAAGDRSTTAQADIPENGTVHLCAFDKRQDRIINVCKVVDDNGIKPDNEGASFGFDVRVHGSNPFHQTHLSAHEGDASPTCENVSLAAHGIPLNANIEVVEWGDPSGWQNAAGYPKNSINGSNGTAPLGTTGTSVTFYNKQATRWITVCKVVEDNGDATKDGGPFKFDVRYGSPTPPYPDQGDLEIPAAFEGDPATQDCQKAEVPANKPAEIVEWGLRPDGWGSLSDDAAGYPKYRVGDGPVISNGTAPVPVDQDVVTFFNKRTPRTGTLRIVKNDTVHAADRGSNTDGDWDFQIWKGAVPFDTASSTAAENSTTTAYDKLVLTGTYVVAELDAVITACGDQATKTYETRIGTAGDPIASTKLVEVTAGGTTTVTFNNLDCGLVAGTAEITVTKVVDNKGDRTMNGSDYLADGWHITVDCGPGNVFQANTGDSAGHTAVFPGLPNNTTCTISETAQAGYGPTGWRSTDTGSGSADGPGTSTTLHADDGDQDTVTFYNQPRVNIHVHKDEVTNAGIKDGKGWTFTLTGCEIASQEKTTPADGDIDFTGLPAAAGCDYTVTETQQTGWTVFPAGSQTASPTAPGATANLTFTNMNIITCGTECIPRQVETPVVPPPPPPPPPPEVTQVAGERTAGPPEPTPIAPSTGTGTTGGGAPATIVLALAGVAMAGSAFAITIFARKPHR